MIKIKRLSKVVLLFSIILIFGGCYDYNELNSLDIISGIGLTFSDNEYKVSYEVINTNLDKDNTDSKKSFVVSGTGKNLSEAIESANSKLNKKPYFEHIKVMLIDTNIDIMKISDYLLRSNTISTNFYLIVGGEIWTIIKKAFTLHLIKKQRSYQTNLIVLPFTKEKSSSQQLQTNRNCSKNFPLSVNKFNH